MNKQIIRILLIGYCSLSLLSTLLAQGGIVKRINHAPSQQAIQIENIVKINSNKLDFSPTFYQDGIVFVSNRKRPKSAKAIVDSKDEWMGDNFMSLYYAGVEDEEWTHPTEFSVNITTRYHEGPVAFSKDGTRIFFTRNNYQNGKKKINRQGDTLLKIYTAFKNGNDWIDIQELPFNTDDYDQCHPTLSSDGKVLIFSSNRNGGYGGMDLYQSEFINGQWSTPVNLGAPINTSKNEVFPFIHQDRTLYFASNGHGGYGGLDVLSSVKSDSSWRAPVNIQSPINSLDDDFGFILDEDQKSGYFSSSRSRGIGKDDIYRFSIVNKEIEQPLEEELQPKSVRKIIAGVVTSGADGKRIEKAKVSLIKHKNGQKMTTLTDDKGEFAFRSILLNGDYSIKVLKEGFNAYAEDILVEQLAQEERAIKEYFFLITPVGAAAPPPRPAAVPIETTRPTPPPASPIATPIIPETTTPIIYKEGMTTDLKVGTRLVLEDILFDYGSHELELESIPVLEGLVSVLNQYPTMGIELSAHTDSRGNATYNERLSRRRAESVVRFFAKKGIRANRLIPIGSGESAIRNGCIDGVACSESQHQENRRIEMKMIKLLGSY